MYEVEITNYESISHAKIVIEGFTTLVGRNHLGKSSVLRAINAALTNQQGTEFIKWGEIFCEVSIKFPNLDILWHKEEGNNFYKVNGILYTKIGKEDPPKEILEAGFKPVIVSDQKINLNYAVQFFPLFLVDKLDSKGADLLTSVYGLDRLYKAIELCNKEQKATQDALRLREKDLSQTKKNLERFQTFPQVSKDFEKVHNYKNLIIEKENKINQLKKWNKLKKELQIDFIRLRPILDVIIPDGSAIPVHIIKYDKLLDFRHEYNRLISYIRRVAPIEKIEIPSEYIIKIKESFLRYKKLIDWNKQYKNLIEEIKRLKKITEITIPEPLTDIEKLKKLRDYHDQLNYYTEDIKGIKRDIKNIEDEIFINKAEIKEFNVCPLCGQQLKDENERN